MGEIAESPVFWLATSQTSCGPTSVARLPRALTGLTATTQGGILTDERLAHTALCCLGPTCTGRLNAGGQAGAGRSHSLLVGRTEAAYGLRPLGPKTHSPRTCVDLHIDKSRCHEALR